MTHFCCFFKFSNFSQIFVEIIWSFCQHLKYGVMLERVVLWKTLVALYLNLFRKSIWIGRAMAGFLEFFWYLVSTEVCLISISILVVLLFHFSSCTITKVKNITGHETWFCNDWIQSVVRVCHDKFENTYLFFDLLLLDSELVTSVVLFTLIVSDSRFCIIFIQRYILNIFYCITCRVFLMSSISAESIS